MKIAFTPFSIILGLMLAMFLSALDQTIVATALATIGRAYSDVESLAWPWRVHQVVAIHGVERRDVQLLHHDRGVVAVGGKQVRVPAAIGVVHLGDDVP